MSTAEVLKARSIAKLNKISEQPPPVKKGSTAASAAKERFGHFPGVTEGYPVAAADREVNEYLLCPEMLPALVNAFCACVAQVERDAARGDLPALGPAEVNAFILPPLAAILEAAMNCYNYVTNIRAVTTAVTAAPAQGKREELERQQEQLLHALWVQVVPKLSALVCGCLLGDAPDTNPTIRRLVARASLLINSMDAAIKTQSQPGGANSLFLGENKAQLEEKQQELVALVAMVVDWDSLSGQITSDSHSYNHNKKVSELISKPTSSDAAQTQTQNINTNNNTNTTSSSSTNANPSNASFIPPPPSSANFHNLRSAFCAVPAHSVPQSKCISEALQALRDVLSPVNPQSTPVCLLPYTRAVQCLLFNHYVYPRLYRFCQHDGDKASKENTKSSEVIESGDDNIKNNNKTSASIQQQQQQQLPTPQIHSTVVLSFLRPLLVQWGASSSFSTNPDASLNVAPSSSPSSAPSASSLWCSPIAVATILCCSALIAPTAESPRVTTPNTSCAGIRTLLKVPEFTNVVQKSLLWLISRLLQIEQDEEYTSAKNIGNATATNKISRNSPSQGNQSPDKCKTLVFGLEMDLIVNGVVNQGNFVVVDDDVAPSQQQTQIANSSTNNNSTIHAAASTTPSPTGPQISNNNNAPSFSSSASNNTNAPGATTNNNNNSNNANVTSNSNTKHIDPLSNIQQVQVSPEMALCIRHCQSWCELFLEIIDGTRTFSSSSSSSSSSSINNNNTNETNDANSVVNTIKRRLMWVLGNVAVQCAKIIAARTYRNPAAVCLAHTCFVGTCEKFVAAVFAFCPPHFDASANIVSLTGLTFREITTTILNDVHDCFFSSTGNNNNNNNNNAYSYLSPVGSPTLSKLSPPSASSPTTGATNTSSSQAPISNFTMSSTALQDQNTNCVTTCLDEMLASLLTASIVLTYATPQSMSAILPSSSGNNNNNFNNANILTQLSASFGISWPNIPVAEETRLYLGPPPPNLIQILVLNSKQQQHKIFTSMIDWLDSHLTAFVVPLINPANYYYSENNADSKKPDMTMLSAFTTSASASGFSTSGSVLDAVSSKILLRAVCEGCLSAVLGPYRRRVNPITLANTVWTCLIRTTTGLASRSVSFLGAETISAVLNLSVSVYGGRQDKNIEEHLVNALIKFLEKNCSSLLLPSSSSSSSSSANPSSSSVLQNVTHQHLTLLRILNRLFPGIDGAPSIAEQPRHHHHHHHHNDDNSKSITTTTVLPTSMSKLIRILVHTYSPNLLGALLPSNDLRNQNQQLSSPEFRNMTSAILALCWQWHFAPSLTIASSAPNASSFQQLYATIFDNMKRICADRPIDSRSPCDWQHICSYLTTVVVDCAQYVECDGAVRCCGLALDQLCRIAAASESVMLSSHLASSFRVIMDEYAMMNKKEKKKTNKNDTNSHHQSSSSRLSTRIMFQNIMRFVVGSCSAIIVKHLPLYNPALSSNSNNNNPTSLKPEIIACRTYCALATLLAVASYRCGATTASDSFDEGGSDEEEEDDNSVVASCFTTLLEIARYCRREVIQGTYRYHRVGSVDLLALFAAGVPTSTASSSSKTIVLSPQSPPWHTNVEDETDDDDEDDDDEKETDFTPATTNKDQQKLGSAAAGADSVAVAAVVGDGDSASARFEKRVRSFAKLLCKICLTSLALPHAPKPAEQSQNQPNPAMSGVDSNKNSIAFWDKKNSRTFGLKLLSEGATSSLLRFVSVDDIGSFEWNVSPYFSKNNNNNYNQDKNQYIQHKSQQQQPAATTVILKPKCVHDTNETKISNLFGSLANEMLAVRGDDELNSALRGESSTPRSPSASTTEFPAGTTTLSLSSPALLPSAANINNNNNHSADESPDQIKSSDPITKIFDPANDAEVEAETKREKLPADGRVVAPEHFAPLLLESLGCLLPAEQPHRRMAPWATAPLKVVANGLEQQDGSYFEQLRNEIASHRNKYHLNIVVSNNNNSSPASNIGNNNNNNRKVAVANKLFHELVETPRMGGVASNEYYFVEVVDQNESNKICHQHGVRRTATEEFHCHLYSSSSNNNNNALDYSFTSYFNATSRSQNPNRAISGKGDDSNISKPSPPSSNSNNAAAASIVVCVVDSIKEMYTTASYYDMLMATRNAKNSKSPLQQQQNLPAILFVVPTVTQDYEQYFNLSNNNILMPTSANENKKSKKQKVNPLDTSSSSSDEDDFFSQQQNNTKTSKNSTDETNQDLLATSSTFVIHVKRISNNNTNNSNAASNSNTSSSSSSSSSSLAALALSSLIFPFFDGAPVRGVPRVATMLRACVLLPAPFAVENYRERRKGLNGATAAALHRMRTMMNVMKTLSGSGGSGSGGSGANSRTGSGKGESLASRLIAGAGGPRSGTGGDYQSGLVEMTPLIAATTQLRWQGGGTSMSNQTREKKPFLFDDNDDSDRQSNDEGEDEEMRRNRRELEMSI